MKIAAYTICNNEIEKIEDWLSYTRGYNYKVILDTGSSDGSFELLKKLSVNDSSIIVSQTHLKDFKFDNAKNLSLNLIPTDTTWCVFTFLDEYYSPNTLDTIHALNNNLTDLTGISCDKLNLRSYSVKQNTPNFDPIINIHVREGYRWKGYAFEKLVWLPKNNSDSVFYSEEIALVNTQIYNKPLRINKLELIEEQYKLFPEDLECLWHLISKASIERNENEVVNFSIKYLEVCSDFNKEMQIINLLKIMLSDKNVSYYTKEQIKELFKKREVIYDQ
jgi:hypothetical protein